MDIGVGAWDSLKAMPSYKGRSLQSCLSFLTKSVKALCRTGQHTGSWWQNGCWCEVGFFKGDALI